MHRNDDGVLGTRLTADVHARRWPALAVAAGVAQAGVLVHALFMPISLQQVQLGILAALAALALAAWRAGARAWVRSPLDLPVAIVALAELAAIAVAAAGGLGPRELETATRWKPVLAPVVLLAALSLPSPGAAPDAPRARAVRALLAWCAGGAVASLTGAAQALLGVDPIFEAGWREAPRLVPVQLWADHHAAVGFYPGYPQFAHNLVPLVALAGALAVAAPLARAVRLALGAGAALALAAVLLSVSRGAWASLVVVVAVALALAGGRLARRGLPLALAGLVAVALAHDGLRTRLLATFANGGTADRALMRSVCAEVWKDHPLGVGPGNFRRVADPYFDRIRPEYGTRTGCHQLPLGLLVEGGPLLAAAWAVAAVLVVRAFLRWRREGDALARAAAAGALAALAGFAANGLFHDVQRESHATWALGLALGLAAVLARPTSPRPPTRPARPAGGTPRG